MSNGNDTIGLLAQRLEAQEKINAKQATQIEAMQALMSEMKGSQSGLDKAAASNAKYLGPVFSLLALLLTAFLINFVAGGVSDAKTKITALETKFDLIKIPSIADVSEKTLANKSHIEKVEEGLLRLRDRVDGNEAKTITLQTEMAAMRTALIEIETQARALNEVMNMADSNVWQAISTLWIKTVGTPLQLPPYYSNKIPAQAIVEIGK